MLREAFAIPRQRGKSTPFELVDQAAFDGPVCRAWVLV